MTSVFNAAEVEKKWSATATAKRLQKKAVRASLSDFGRYKFKVAQQKKSAVVGKAFRTLKRGSKALKQ